MCVPNEYQIISLSFVRERVEGEGEGGWEGDGKGDGKGDGGRI